MSLTPLLFSISLLFSLLISSLPPSTALLPTQLIYQFPNDTFVENIAIRPSGALLTTLATAPELYLIQPSPTHPTPFLVHRFPNATALTGITETTRDTFLVAATTIFGLGQIVPNSSTLWQVSFPNPHSPQAHIRLFARLPAVLEPNGMVTLSARTVLLADPAAGVVFAIDLPTSTARIALSGPLFAATPTLPVGVNGLKLLGSTLYFTNTAQNLLGRINIDLKTGAARGLASVISRGLPPALGYDDFALSSKGIAYVANAGGDFIERVDVRSGGQGILAGMYNSTEIAEPTSAALGRGRWEDTLFVTTAGGFSFPVRGSEIVGGQVLAVKLGRRYERRGVRRD